MKIIRKGNFFDITTTIIATLQLSITTYLSYFFKNRKVKKILQSRCFHEKSNHRTIFFAVAVWFDFSVKPHTHLCPGRILILVIYFLYSFEALSEQKRKTRIGQENLLEQWDDHDGLTHRGHSNRRLNGSHQRWSWHNNSRKW